MSHVLIKRVREYYNYPSFSSFSAAREYIERNIHEFSEHGEIILLVDYETGATTVLRINCTTTVEEL